MADWSCYIIIQNLNSGHDHNKTTAKQIPKNAAYKKPSLPMMDTRIIVLNQKQITFRELASLRHCVSTTDRLSLKNIIIRTDDLNTFRMMR